MIAELDAVAEAKRTLCDTVILDTPTSSAMARNGSGSGYGSGHSKKRAFASP